MAKILLVEDDAELAEKVRALLAEERYLVEWTSTGEDALLLLKSFAFDLIVLDWLLPGMSGIDVLKESRSVRGRTPVLMLTGKVSVLDIETGLDAGAADYLKKPFHMRELNARVRALLRRDLDATQEETLSFRWISVDPRSKSVLKNGEPIKLQPLEFALLEFLLRHPKDIFSLEALMNSVWPSEIEASPDTVRVCITRLRNKIDTEGEPSLIKTVHRVGYSLDG